MVILSKCHCFVLINLNKLDTGCPSLVTHFSGIDVDLQNMPLEHGL